MTARAGGRVWWLAGLLLAAVPLAAAAQVGFGFGLRYRNAPYDGRLAILRARYQAYPGWAYDYPAMENNLARVLHDITTIRPNLEAANILDFDDPELFDTRWSTCRSRATGIPTASEARAFARTSRRAGSSSSTTFTTRTSGRCSRRRCGACCRRAASTGWT